MSFRFNAKTVFLTYAQCALPKEEVLERVAERFPIQDYIVAREKHQDGGLHLHCYFRFVKKVDSRDPRVFDVLDCHPNIKPLTKVEAIKNAQKYFMNIDGLKRKSKEHQDLISSMEEH